MRRFLIILILLLSASYSWAGLPEKGVVIPGVDEASMKARFAESDLQALEGIWEYPSEKMTLAIERTEATYGMAYRVILLSSDDIELLPGTVMGYIESSADKKKYRLWLYSERNKLAPQKPLECVATLSADGTSLTFEPPHYKVKVSVNVVRLFTNIFRGVSVRPDKVEEKLPIGFRKVYPANGNGNTFNEIRYL